MNTYGTSIGSKYGASLQKTGGFLNECTATDGPNAIGNRQYSNCGIKMSGRILWHLDSENTRSAPGRTAQTSMPMAERQYCRPKHSPCGSNSGFSAALTRPFNPR